MNPRSEIISLLRGQVACPVISSLAQVGWLDRMIGNASFDSAEVGQNVNARMFAAIMNYLASLGLVRQLGNGRFETTELGLKVLRRHGAFGILSSYEDYMRRLPSLLVDNSARPPEVDRTRNVVGSGALHAAKFFEPTIEKLGTYDVVADIGCGDGQFLSSVVARFPSVRPIGIDLSPVAIHQTLCRFGKDFPNIIVKCGVANAADVEEWSNFVRRHVSGQKVLISFWFVVHEISKSEPDIVIDFFKTLHDRCPDADILIGEVTRLSTQSLLTNKSESIMPELTLLHDISGQGLLTWDEWNYVAKSISYELSAEIPFDAVAQPDGDAHPSNFVWLLSPR